jgi:hypothetical protein
MSFWKQHQKVLQQRWELHRRQIEREVAENRRDLVRRGMRQSSEWNRYEQYSDWYLEREVTAFVTAVDEISAPGHLEIDDEALDEMDRMLLELIDRRRQQAPPEALRDAGADHTQVKGSARVGLLRIQALRRAEREQGASAPAAPPVRRAIPDPPMAAPASPAASSVSPAVEPPTSEPTPAPERPITDAQRLADSLRRLAQLIQQLPDPEAQAESLEELQFVAEEATTEPDQRKLRMVAATLVRITERLSTNGTTTSEHVRALAAPVQRWFDVR